MQHRIPGHFLRLSHDRRAFTLVELAIVVLVLGVVVAGVVQMTNRYSAQRYDTQTAQEVKNMTSAVEAFIKNNAAEITKGDNGTKCGFLSVDDTTATGTFTPISVTFAPTDPTILNKCDANSPKVVDAIKAYLPANFSPANTYLIGFKRAANISTADATATGPNNPGVANISAMVMRQASAGDNLTDTRLARIASSIGSQGGFIAGNGTNATGAFGGWSADPASYGLTTSANSIAALTTFSATNSVFNTNMLSRVLTGNHEANTMRTNLDMGNDTSWDNTTLTINDKNEIKNVGVINGIPSTNPNDALDANNLAITLNGKLQGRKMPGMQASDANSLELNPKTILQAGVGGINLGTFIRGDGASKTAPSTTAIAGKYCVYEADAAWYYAQGNVKPNGDPNFALDFSTGQGSDIRHAIGIYGPVSRFVNSMVNLVTASGSGSYPGYIPYFLYNGDVYGTSDAEFDKVQKLMVPMTTTIENLSGTIAGARLRIGYNGRIVVGRNSDFDDESTLLICDGMRWRLLNQTGLIGPVNPAWAAASVLGPQGSIKTTYAPFEKNGSGEQSPRLQGNRKSRQLFATLGTNTICGWNNIQYSGQAGNSYQLACGTPKEILGKQACFWSNGTGGLGNDDPQKQHYPVQFIDAGNLFNLIPGIELFAPGFPDRGRSAGDTLASFSNMKQRVNIAYNQQICPGGYYVAGTAVNSDDNAPMLDLRNNVANNASNGTSDNDLSCGNGESDCTYIYCCPFNPDPDLNLYDTRMIYNRDKQPLTPDAYPLANPTDPYQGN